jgi:hypothetical protein
MKNAGSIPIVCSILSGPERHERERLWGELKDAVIGIEPQRDGFTLTLKATRAIVESVGRLIALERDCCRFLHIRWDVPPSIDDTAATMTLTLTGRAGAKDFLASALTNLGLAIPAARGRSRRWRTLGVSALSFALLCCIAPPLLVAAGLTGLAGWFAALDSPAGLFIAIASGAVFYGVHKVRSRNGRCDINC